MARFQRTLSKRQRDTLWHEAQCDFERDLGEGHSRDHLLAEIKVVQDNIRLFDDLGWEKVDERETYTLTMPDDQLERILGRLRHSACELIEDELDGPFTSGETGYTWQCVALLHTCLEVEGKVAA